MLILNQSAATIENDYTCRVKALIQIVSAFSLQSAAGCDIIKIVSAVHFQAVVPDGSAGETG